MKTPRAFTLVELLVVISIITLLIGILTPSLMVAKSLGRVSTCSSNINGTVRNVQMYLNANNGLLPPYRVWTNPATSRPTANDPNTGKPFAPEQPWRTTLVFGDPNTTPPPGSSYDHLLTDPRNLGFVHKDGYINDYRILYCPAQPNAENTLAPYPLPWGYDPNNALNAIQVGYMYNPNIKHGGAAEYLHPFKVEIFPVDCPFVCDLVYGADFVSHTVGVDWRWNVGRVNGNVTTVASSAIQREMKNNPAWRDFKDDWNMVDANSQVYKSLLMK